MILQYILGTRTLLLEQVISIASKNFKSIADIKNPPNIIVIDEIHMFDPKDILQIDKLLKNNHEVYLSG